MASNDGRSRHWSFGYDHAGFRLAQILARAAVSRGYSVTHFGPSDDHQPVDYVPFCVAAATQVATGASTFGLVIGGSGQGEQIAANKVRGIRAALCPDLHYTMLARRDNDANVLAVPARLIAPELAIQVLDVWLTTKFEGGRHARRLSHIADYEGGLLALPEPTSVQHPAGDDVS